MGRAEALLFAHPAARGAAAAGCGVAFARSLRSSGREDGAAAGRAKAGTALDHLTRGGGNPAFHGSACRPDHGTGLDGTGAGGRAGRRFSRDHVVAGAAFFRTFGLQPL